MHQYLVSFAVAPPPHPTTTTPAMHTTSVLDRVMLATAVILVRASCEENLPARALLDSGSQVNFMMEDLAQKLRIRRQNRTLNMIGIGNSNTKVGAKLSAFVKSRYIVSNFRRNSELCDVFRQIIQTITLMLMAGKFSTKVLFRK